MLPRPRVLRPVLLAAALVVGAGAALAQPSAQSDPRVGLRAGIANAAVAARGMELVGQVPKPAGFFNPDDPGDFNYMNSDLAFRGTTLFMGNFAGIQIFDIADPTKPRLRVTINCPGGQGDVSVHGDLLFMSVEDRRGRLDCGAQGVEDTVSAERFVGVRVFDIQDLDRPRQVAAVQTCRGSHTHTLLVPPNDPANVYVYVAGSAPVRSKNELAGCASTDPNVDPTSALFRLEVIKVPVHHPERAAIVSSPRIFAGLTAPPTHGASAADIARAAQEAAAARAAGKFTVLMRGEEVVVPDPFAAQSLAGIVQQRGGTGAPTAADSAAFRAMLPGIVARMVGDDSPEALARRPGPNQCHDVTVFPEVGLAGGACEGYGLLLDIRDPANPVRIAAAADSNFAYWHSATFNNDGTKVIFTDEWGGGTQPKCRATDKPEWGANAVFTIRNGRDLQFESYYKLPAAQTAQENCVAHNGSLVPVPGRDIMVQAWYQGGVSVFDFTDPARPVELAYFDRGPMDAERMLMAGHWSAYWYNGRIYASEIGRGLDVFRLTPGPNLTANEIAAAEAVRDDVVNSQHQTKVTWTPSVTVARAYLDQLARSNGLPAARRTAVTAALDRAARATTPAAKRTAATALTTAARSVEADARTTTADPARLRLLAATLEGLGTTLR